MLPSQKIKYQFIKSSFIDWLKVNSYQKTGKNERLLRDRVKNLPLPSMASAYTSIAINYPFCLPPKGDRFAKIVVERSLREKGLELGSEDREGVHWRAIAAYSEFVRQHFAYLCLASRGWFVTSTPDVDCLGLDLLVTEPTFPFRSVGVALDTGTVRSQQWKQVKSNRHQVELPTFHFNPNKKLNEWWLYDSKLIDVELSAYFNNKEVAA